MATLGYDRAPRGARMRLALLAAALVVLIGAPRAWAAPTSEQLVMRPYPGPTPWKRITDQANATQWMHEQIPGDQTVDSFTDILTDDGFRELGGRDPSQFLRVVFDGFAKACDGVRLNGPVARSEGGFAVAYGQVYCGRKRGADFGVQVFYKVIGGAAALYSISREFHVPPSADGGQPLFPNGEAGRAKALVAAESVAGDYLARGVYLCGGRSTDPRCSP
jgi:hypothetical protein